MTDPALPLAATGTLLDHLNRRVHADLRAAIEKREQAEQAERFLRGPSRLYRTSPRPSWEAFRWPCPAAASPPKEQQ